MKHTFSTRQFSVNLRSLREPVVGMVLASILIVFFRKPFELWIVGIVSACLILPRLLPLARVVVAESYIEIRPLLPFLATRNVLTDDVSHYEDCPIDFRGKIIPMFGRLHFRDGTHKAIWASGTTGFSELSSILAERFAPNDPGVGVVSETTRCDRTMP